MKIVYDWKNKLNLKNRNKSLTIPIRDHNCDPLRSLSIRAENETVDVNVMKDGKGGEGRSKKEKGEEHLTRCEKEIERDFIGSAAKRSEMALHES